jgi:hypothetical protein
VRVAAKWPDGEDIRGFSSEADASEWIANELNLEQSKRLMSEKHPDTRHEGGPVASQENRKDPQK